MVDTSVVQRKAEVLIEALPYIKKFQGSTILVKYGGSLMFEREAQERFCNDIVLLKYIGMNPVVVHGGGKEITRWLERIGKQAKFIDGLRVTDEETMEVTEMVLSGKLNRGIVASMNEIGGKAVGLSGKDASLLIAHIKKGKKGEDLGLVGEVKTVNSQLIKVLADSGYIPIISSVAIGIDGQTLNVNADEAAAAVAIALQATKLVYLTDVDGIQKGGKLIDFLELKDAEELLGDPEVTGGMIPKLECCIKAVKGGVQSVHMVNGNNPHAVLLEMFTDHGIGTMLQHRKVLRK